MIKRIVLKKGKKYIVNCVGWEDGIGPGGPSGTLWMKSTDGNWYAVSITGTNPSATIYINQSPLQYYGNNFQTNDLGYQLLNGSGGNIYQIYLSGNAGSVTINVNLVPVLGVGNGKPYFNLQSITDTAYYQVYLNASNVLTVNQSSHIVLDGANNPSQFQHHS